MALIAAWISVASKVPLPSKSSWVKTAAHFCRSAGERRDMFFLDHPTFGSHFSASSCRLILLLPIDIALDQRDKKK
jgi:hypothetical protein